MLIELAGLMRMMGPERIPRWRLGTTAPLDTSDPRGVHALQTSVPAAVRPVACL